MTRKSAAFLGTNGGIVVEQTSTSISAELLGTPAPADTSDTAEPIRASRRLDAAPAPTQTEHAMPTPTPDTSVAVWSDRDIEWKVKRAKFVHCPECVRGFAEMHWYNAGLTWLLVCPCGETFRPAASPWAQRGPITLSFPGAADDEW